MIVQTEPSGEGKVAFVVGGFKGSEGQFVTHSVAHIPRFVVLLLTVPLLVAPAKDRCWPTPLSFLIHPFFLFNIRHLAPECREFRCNSGGDHARERMAKGASWIALTLRRESWRARFQMSTVSLLHEVSGCPSGDLL